MPILRVARAHARVVHAWAAMVRAMRRFVRFWASVGASGGAKYPKIEDSLPWTPMNSRAKFDASSFILGKEIRNRTNKQTNKISNNNRYIRTLPIGMCG